MTAIAEQFEQQRPRLRSLAFRMLGSFAEADDAVQEAWLRLHRSDAAAIDNLAAWLTTVVAHVSLDMLRSRQSRREDPLLEPAPHAARAATPDPEQEAILADAVGIAMLVVLERLSPPERLAFVLHDSFALPFDEIAAILGRSPAAVRQLASRARRRVRGGGRLSGPLAEQRQLVASFLVALRAGDVPALLALLDPAMVAHADAAATGTGSARDVHGAANWAQGAVAFSRRLQAPAVAPALVNGSPGLLWAPAGKLTRVLTFQFAGGRITRVDILADPAALSQLDLTLLP